MPGGGWIIFAIIFGITALAVLDMGAKIRRKQ